MKRFWLVLLSLGLIVAFSASAMAVDVKFSGEYYAAGMYLDRTNVNKTSYTIPATFTTPAKLVDEGPSTAFYFQRLRLGTDFVVSPGLKLVTRADIMERAWGANRTAPGVAQDVMSAGTRSENENVAFDLLYVSYVSPIGMFNVGYQIDDVWGTVWGNSSNPKGKIAYYFKTGGLTLILQAGKDKELSRSVNNPLGDADKDQSFYTAAGIYSWKTGEAGLLFKYIKNNQFRNIASTPLTQDAGFTWDGLITTPYVKAKLGPVALQAQIYYLYGEQSWEGNRALLGNPPDVDLSQLTAWIDATVDFGKFYVGGSLAYVSGDDPDTKDEAEGGVLGGGLDYNPCLIMFNNDLTYWVGRQGGYNGSSNGGVMTNAYFGQLRAGVRPIDKLDIMASVSYATADKTPQAVWDSREYGYEIDLTATYKITNNLSYMLGGGYWIVGDYYTGTAAAGQDVDDNFMVINKLTLTF
ncbi:MAG: hypothetical protein GYA67_08420 [Smithella sp.]|nr:hypothetical protein [Smithella sp.]